ncbi:MAG: PHP domain-containing protein [Longimonas sp.]|uniref:PHP domain-containing protein n=1 Tax=Longimonas sp. TaxID=2039626 RepID=UPI00397560A3
MVYADLHTHSTASDGHLAPRDLVREAKNAKLGVLALTDHDTVAGITEAQAAAAEVGLVFVPGVECTVHHKGHGIHLLGYGFDPTDAALTRHFDRYATARIERAQAIVEKLQSVCRLDITWADVQRHVPAGDGVVARPHIAAALQESGAVESVGTAFDAYLGDNKPAYVPLPEVEAAWMIDQIHEAGGITAVAHPGHWLPGRVLRGLIDAGLDALECVHPSHDASLEAYYRNRAHANSLHVTGGSDFHGPLHATARGVGHTGLSRRAWERMAAACT